MVLVFKLARGLVALVALAGTACGGGASGGASGGAADVGEESSGDESGGNDPQLQVPSESCAAAPSAQGRAASVTPPPS